MLVLNEFIKFLGLETKKQDKIVSKKDYQQKNQDEIVDITDETISKNHEEIEIINNGKKEIHIKKIIEIIPIGNKKAIKRKSAFIIKTNNIKKRK